MRNGQCQILKGKSWWLLPFMDTAWAMHLKSWMFIDHVDDVLHDFDWFYALIDVI